MSIKLRKTLPEGAMQRFSGTGEMEIELEFDTVEEMQSYFDLEERAYNKMFGQVSECGCCDDYDDDDYDDYDDDPDTCNVSGQMSIDELKEFTSLFSKIASCYENDRPY